MVDRQLRRIDYTANAAAGIAPHARVEFVYSGPHVCAGSDVPIGARFDYRTGIRLYEGAMRLDRIDVYVDGGDGFVKRREVTLDYDADAARCDRLHAPLRMLAQIRERAWSPDGVDSALPPTRFTYGALAPTAHAPNAPRRPLPELLGWGAMEFSVASGRRRLDPSKSGGLPTTEARLLDVDGDGRVDALRAREDLSAEECRFEWTRNGGGGTPRLGALPILPWADGVARNGSNVRIEREGCSLSGQVSRRRTDGIDVPCGLAANYVGYHFFDLDGDHVVDLLTSLDYQKGAYRPALDPQVAPYPAAAEAAPCLDGDGNRVACLLDGFYSGELGVTYREPSRSDQPSDCPEGTCPPPLGYECDSSSTDSGGGEGGDGGDGGDGGGDESRRYGDTVPVNCCMSIWCEGKYDPAVLQMYVGAYFDPPIPSPPWADPDTGWLWDSPPDLPDQEDLGVLPPARLNRACSQVPEMHRGWYVARVHRGDGTGQFSSAEESVHLLPAPVQSDRPFGVLGGPLATAGAWQGFMDLDGDGLLDQVFTHPKHRPYWPGGPAWRGGWFLFRGDGTGDFATRDDGRPYVWAVPDRYVPSGRGWAPRALVHLARSYPVTKGPRGRPRVARRHRFDVVTTLDINGDGLPDYVDGRDGDVRVFYNTGAGFERPPAGVARGTQLTADFDTLTRNEEVVFDASVGETRYGYSMSVRRVLDYDGDGLPEVFALPPPDDTVSDPWAQPWSVTTYVNFGDRLIARPSPELATIAPALARILVSTPQWWAVKTDVLDFDGDGMLDAYNNDTGCDADRNSPQGLWGMCGLSTEVASSVDAGQGLRLLREIDNGRGMKLTVNYAPVTDGEVVTVADGYRAPAGVWVVRDTTVTDAASGTESTVRYRYHNPVSNRDRFGRFGFRGFEQVTRVGPANASGLRRRTVERYGYDVDPTGRRAVVEQYAECSADAPDRACLYSIEETDWRALELFESTARSYHVAERRTYTCHAAPTAAACREQDAMVRVVYGYGPLSVTAGAPVAEAAATDRELPDWVITASPVPPRSLPVGVLRPALRAPAAGLVAGPGGIGRPPVVDRPPANPGPARPPVAEIPPAEDVPPADEVEPPPPADALCGAGDAATPPGVDLGARVAVMYVQCAERITARVGPVTAGDRGSVTKHRLVYEAGAYQLLPTDTRRYVATADGNDRRWGTVKLIGRTQTRYDERGLPVETSTWLDEGTVAVTARTYDPDTGVLLSVQKPEQQGTDYAQQYVYDSHRLYAAETIDELGHRVRSVVDLATGAELLVEGPEQPGGAWPGERVTIDGFGRPVARWRRTGAPGGGLREVQVAAIEYRDDSVPATVTTRARIDSDDDRWSVVQTAVDGLGRTLRVTRYGGDQGPATTTYRYDAAGNVTDVVAPNPSDQGGPTATVRYAYDGLGRVVRVTPPVGAPAVVTYELLAVHRTQEPGDGSAAAPTTVYYDVFGRLRTVVEQGPDGDAVTSYDYDANDQLSVVENADGIVTRLEHDFAGRRRAIERGGRRWQYAYDRNGNLVRTWEPSASAAGALLPTTFFRYDALDRVVSRTVIHSGSNGTQRQRWFGTTQSWTSTTYDYDDDGTGIPNSVGRLRRVRSPGVDERYRYSPEGWLIEQRRTVRARAYGGQLDDTRVVRYRYSAQGVPVETEHADGSTRPPTVTATDYDDRGQPAALWASGGATGIAEPVLLARLARNRTGAIVSRTNGFAAPAQRWHYDPFGRVIDHRIGPVGAPIAGETLAYDDVGNVERHTLHATGITFLYAYDHQRQLVGATSTDGASYDAEFAYTAAGRVARARVATALRDTPVAPRDVRYVYPPANEAAGPPVADDPEAVVAMRDATTGATVADYAYNVAGDVVRKAVGDEVWLLAYDGNHDLREVCRQPAGACETYYYDANGARVAAIRTAYGDEPARARQWFGDAEVEYKLAGGQWRPSRELVFAYLGGQPVARIVDGAIAEPEFVYSGVLSHLLVVTGAGGDVRARYAYTPFGEVLWQDGERAADYHRLYSGKERDELSGLDYYGFRYYDPLALRWTQRDPLYAFAPDLAYDQPRRMGLYTFVLNNPLRYIDPDGRDAATPVPLPIYIVYPRTINVSRETRSKIAHRVTVVFRNADALVDVRNKEAPISRATLKQFNTKRDVVVFIVPKTKAAKRGMFDIITEFVERKEDRIKSKRSASVVPGGIEGRTFGSYPNNIDPPPLDKKAVVFVGSAFAEDGDSVAQVNLIIHEIAAHVLNIGHASDRNGTITTDDLTKSPNTNEKTGNLDKVKKQVRDNAAQRAGASTGPTNQKDPTERK